MLLYEIWSLGEKPLANIKIADVRKIECKNTHIALIARLSVIGLIIPYMYTYLLNVLWHAYTN